MKELKLTISDGEIPPSEAAIEGAQNALTELKSKVAGVCTAAAVLALIGFFGLEIKWIGLAAGETPMKAAYAVGLIVFLSGRAYQKAIEQRIAEVSPIDDSLLAEAATLAGASAAARDYVSAIRQTKREMILAELKALRKHAADTPVETARQTLYG